MRKEQKKISTTTKIVRLIRTKNREAKTAAGLQKPTVKSSRCFHQCASSFMNFVALLTKWLMLLLDVMAKRSVNPLRSQILPYNMSSEELMVTEWAMRFSGWVWGDVYDDVNTVELEDEDDKVLIRFEEGTCYAVFRGANETMDRLQTIPSMIGRQVCGGEGCCVVERGMYNAYYSDFNEEFEDAVRACHQRCDEGCPVVFSGHSQVCSCLQKATQLTS